jgi:plasmid stabilization system protein ParE
MASVRLLRRADADLEEAVAWYEARSPQAARRFEDAVIVALERIAAMPEMYALVDDQHRLCPVRRSQYLIVYRYDANGDEIVVVAVAHAKQDPPARLSGS